jgi:release factor glutamine methyltransferase
VRKSIKHLASLVMIPAVRWYLRKERGYTYDGLKIRVMAGVFHPGFFYSTKFILSFLKQQKLEQQSLLELGCGSGLIAVFASKQGAEVTASDLSRKAIENTQQNAERNGAPVTTVLSDLFENIPKKNFDWIIINPPYYAKSPGNDQELAWYCGPDFEYFKKLFSSLNLYLHGKTQVIMVLTKGCDIPVISAIAGKSGYSFDLISEKNVLFDGKDFLYRIQKTNSSA